MSKKIKVQSSDNFTNTNLAKHFKTGSNFSKKNYVNKYV